jgi:hypothetical protein
MGNAELIPQDLSARQLFMMAEIRKTGSRKQQSGSQGNSAHMV